MQYPHVESTFGSLTVFSTNKDYPREIPWSLMVVHKMFPEFPISYFPTWLAHPTYWGGFHPSSKWTNLTYPIYNQGHHVLSKFLVNGMSHQARLHHFPGFFGCFQAGDSKTEATALLLKAETHLQAAFSGAWSDLQISGNFKEYMFIYIYIHIFYIILYIYIYNI